MFIKVINWCNHNILAKDSEPTFYLERDNWDDNYFKTRYHLHLSGKYTGSEEAMWIGELKILRKGQRRDDKPLLEPGSLDYLGHSFCSAGQSLDYYEKISRLEKPLRYQILSALRDTIIYPEIIKDFQNEAGMGASLFNHLDKDDEIFTLAPAIISDNFESLPPLNINFKFEFPTLKEPVEFNFKSTRYGDESLEGIIRISVISPENDHVKTGFLSRLAQIAYASGEARDLRSEKGIISPAGIAFTKIICLSYSDVPEFSIPGIYVREKEKIAREANYGTGRFIYCGIHDMVEELEQALQSYTIDTDGRVWEHSDQYLEPSAACLKSTGDLCAEFIDVIERIELKTDKQAILDNVFLLLQEQGLKFIAGTSLLDLRKDELGTFFMNLNSGQQFLFHALTTCILSICPRSLVLFDEREGGIPVSLLPLMMKSMNYILESEDAFMILSTRSTDIFSEESTEKMSAVNSKEFAPSFAKDKEKRDKTEDVVISHILGPPNDDIFPRSS